jgi:membrane fusion protein, hemolysin D
VVQPTEAGIVQEILVREGEQVRVGQVLMRMDTKLAEADSHTVQSDLAQRSLQLRRIEAELAGAPLKPRTEDPAEAYRQAQAQYLANRLAYEDALAQEQAVLARSKQDLAAAQALEEKLRQSLSLYQEREEAYEKLGREGFAGRIMVLERQKERMEKEQELQAQAHAVVGYRASIAQSEKRSAQITSNYRQQLHKERAEAYTESQRLEQIWAKQQHKNTLLELKAPQAGTVKDLATHTPGTVVQPGTVLMTLVPLEEPLHAEVWISNQDVGFVQPGQRVRLKLATFPFQKYGLLEGTVSQVGADATEPQGAGEARREPAQLSYRALVALASQVIQAEGRSYSLQPGMQVSAEINLGDRTVLEYLFSPVQKTFHEAARER